MRADDKRTAPSTILLASAALAFVSMVAFMTIGAKGSWSFLLSFRGTKLLGMVLVAYAIAVSTVPKPVMMIVSALGAACPMASRSSMPPMRGILRSLMTMS